MDVISYSVFRTNLASTLDQVNDNHKPVLITRKNGRPPTVLISLEDFQSYEETAYLMVRPKNAERLNQAIEQAEAGKIQQHELITE